MDQQVYQSPIALLNKDLIAYYTFFLSYSLLAKFIELSLPIVFLDKYMDLFYNINLVYILIHYANLQQGVVDLVMQMRVGGLVSSIMGNACDFL
jgi:hypothetical protein